MPSRKDPFVVLGRFGRHLMASALPSLAARLAFADHGLPSPARTGFGWMSWLLVAGAVVAVSLAAWAFFAPDHEPDRGREPAGPAPPGGGREEPPAR